MKAPLCKTCGKREVGHLCLGKRTKEETLALVKARVPLIGPELDVSVVKQKFDRNVYQREYMKKRRAAKKVTVVGEEDEDGQSP